tara:strand:+ start:31837 stop:33033 length:1197 start_codon:yes stop_codon:yes gene_type:complete
MIHLVNRVDSKLSTIMVAFDSGQRIELQNGFNMGIAHMLEHCLFKGTRGRDASQISRDIGFIGGASNAFTSHEMVAYFITVPYENIEAACEILSDILLNSTIPEEEFLKEREVVKEEEISRLDDVDSFIWNTFSDDFFTNYLSTPVIGTQDTISKFTRDEVYSFYKNFCGTKKGVVCISGKHTKRASKKLLKKYFGRPTSDDVSNSEIVRSAYSSGRKEIVRPGIEHTYVWVGYPGVPRKDALDPAARILSIILGSGMDSRLFSEVRENRGLCYSIGSSHSQWDGGELFMVESSTREENLDGMLDIIDGELKTIKESGVTDEELQRAKNKIKSAYYALDESSYGMCTHSIKNMLFGTPMVDDLICEIDKVTNDDVLNAANKILDSDKKYTIVCRGIQE